MVCAAVAVVLLVVCPAARAAEDVVHFFNAVDVEKDKTVRDAVCFFCDVNVEGAAHGDVVVFFGSAHISGHADRDVVVFFGSVTAENGATVGHNLVNFFGSSRLGENADVGQDAVVLFGRLRAAGSANIGGNRVVGPRVVFGVPFVLIFLVFFVLGQERRMRRRRMFLGGY